MRRFTLLLAAALVPFAAHAEAVATPMTLDGIIHADSDDTLAFTPDGNTVFFDRSEGTHKDDYDFSSREQPW